MVKKTHSHTFLSSKPKKNGRNKKYDENKKIYSFEANQKKIKKNQRKLVMNKSVAKNLKKAIRTPFYTKSSNNLFLNKFSRIGGLKAGRTWLAKTMEVKFVQKMNYSPKESWPNEEAMGITWEDLMKTRDMTEEEKLRDPLLPTDDDADLRIETYFPVRGICPVEGCRHNLIITINPFRIQCSRYPRCSHTEVKSSSSTKLKTKKKKRIFCYSQNYIKIF